MRQILTMLMVVITTFIVVQPVEAHPTGIPIVDLGIKLDETSLVYSANVPALVIDPLVGEQVSAGSALPCSRGEIQEFFAQTCPVKIDGIEVRPVLVSIEFESPELPTQDGGPYDEATPERGVPGPMAWWVNARIALAYSTKGDPRQVSMVWNVFTGEAVEQSDFVLPMNDVYGEFQGANPDEVLAVADLFGKKTILKFTPDEPGYTWHADGLASRAGAMADVPIASRGTITLPLIPIVAGLLLMLLLLATRAERARHSLAAVAAAIILLAGVAGQNVGRVTVSKVWRGIEIPDEARALELFAALHKNVYRAFDYETEDGIYDALAHSVSGDLLDEIYNDVYQGLVMRDQGGAVSKIERVVILRSEKEDAAEVNRREPQFNVSCDWRVLGLVEHWGHAHRRVNEYSAIYTLTPVGDEWKISAVEMRDQKRVTGKSK
jgi:hypothetical protein